MLIATVVFLAFGLGLRAGHIRAVAWIYFDLAWPGIMRNGIFTSLPMGVIGLGAYILSLVSEPVDHSPGNTLTEDVVVLIVLASLVLVIVTLFRPPRFLKPRWIRDADRELRADPSGRAELVRRLRRRG